MTAAIGTSIVFGGTTRSRPGNDPRMESASESGAAFDDALRRLVHAFERFDTRWRIDWGLSPTEKLIITHLWAAGSASMTELARTTGVSTGGATAIVDRLEREGYVERGPDKADRRRQLVRLTPEGRLMRSRLDLVVRRVAEEFDDPGAVAAQFEVVARELERDADLLLRHEEERVRAGGRVPPLTG